MAGVFDQPDCAAQHLVQPGQSLSLTSPMQENGVTLFRHTLYVRVPLDQRCQRLTLAPTSSLQVRFEPTTVHITAGDEAWVKKWESQPDSATVALLYPAPIGKVLSDIYGRVALHRVDGEAVSEQATVTVDTGQALQEAFVAPAFQAVFSEPDLGGVAKRVSDQVRKKQSGAHMSLSAAAVTQSSGEFGDISYEEQKLQVMMEAALSQLDVTGMPTTPRLRLMSADAGESLWQWLEAGEHSSPVSYAAQGADLAEQWQPALDRALALRDPAATQLVLPLQIESDAPCGVVLQQANLEFLLEADLLSAPVQLAFAGGAEQTQPAPLEAPAAQPLRLHLEATIALREPRNAGEPPALPEGARRTGIQMDEGMQVAALWQADSPVWLIGFAIAWYAISERAALHLSLLAEAGGPAAAAALVEASLDAAATGPTWVRCTWPQTAVQPGRYWLRVAVEKGSGLWLGEAAAAVQTVWQRTPPAPGELIGLPLRPLHFPLAPAGAEQAAQPLVRLALNGVAVAASCPQPETLAADVDAPAALAAPSPWVLEVSTASELTFTLQSARLSYRG